MSWKIELHSFSREEILAALAALNEASQTSKRQIIVTPEQFSSLEHVRPLPNDPLFPQGEIIPGVAGYLYNLPVFVDQDSGGNYLL